MITLVKHLSTCTAAAAAVLAVATLPHWAGSPTPWFVLAGGYGLLAAWAVWTSRRHGGGSDWLRLRSGDLTLGIVTGLVLAGAAFLGLKWLAPTNSPRAAWLFALYAQFGDVQGEVLRSAALLAVVAFEEVVWRGLVQTQATTAWGPTKGLLWTSALYAIAHVPTLFTLQAPGAGLNPLLVLGALACGLFWGLLVLLTQRLAPAIVCHAVLSYFVAAPAPSWLW